MGRAHWAHVVSTYYAEAVDDKNHRYGLNAISVVDDLIGSDLNFLDGNLGAL
jgi:hypothetical protein